VPLPHPSPTAPMPVMSTILFERSKTGIMNEGPGDQYNLLVGV
jgi:hypothetical protein